MTSPFALVHQWVSPVCFSSVVGLILLGSRASDPVLQGWTGAIYWGTCGALAATGTISAALSFLAAQRHLQGARAQLRRRRDGETGIGRLVPKRRGEYRS
jgi:hypothetical protein